MIATGLIAAIVTTSVVGVSAPASIPADDPVYPSVVREGLSVSHQELSDTSLNAIGHLVCRGLDAGMSKLEVARAMMSGFNQESPTDPLTIDETGFVIGASTAAYCPSYVDDPVA